MSRGRLGLAGLTVAQSALCLVCPELFDLLRGKIVQASKQSFCQSRAVLEIERKCLGDNVLDFRHDYILPDSTLSPTRRLEACRHKWGSDE